MHRLTTIKTRTTTQPQQQKTRFDLSKEDVVRLKELVSNLDSIEFLQANYENTYKQMIRCGEIKAVPSWEDINPARDRNKSPKYNQLDIHRIREILHVERQKIK